MVSCAASLQKPNSSLHCRGDKNAHLVVSCNCPGTAKMSTPTKLFAPYKPGPITLPNRLVMAPLTRNRAVAGLVPSPLAIEYYGQRASAGLLVTEASQVSQQ